MNDAPAPIEPADIDRLADLLRACGPAVVLTGAGISTESGIPDFRSPGGLYESIDPMEYLSVPAFQRRPGRFWKMFAQVFAPVAACLPNGGHLALARMEAAGVVRAVVTQNIDGLHHRAGSNRVIELHGHLGTARCTSCTARVGLSEALGQLDAPGIEVPVCERCGAWMRPDVVLFGDMLETFQDAVAECARAELMLVVGSSLEVSPANSLVGRTCRLAIVNRDATALDGYADLLARGSAGRILAALAERLGCWETSP